VVRSPSLDPCLPHRRPKKKEGSTIHLIQWVSDRASHRWATPHSTVKEKAKTDLLMCVFGCFAGNDVVHSWQEGEEGRKPLRISPCFLDFAAVREPTRHQLWWHVEQTRRHRSYSSWGPPMQFLDFLGTFFVMVTCLKMYLNYC